ncbi:MAG: hypothetical protein AAGA29_03540 [Planctomycetota bacterium]
MAIIERIQRYLYHERYSAPLTFFLGVCLAIAFAPGLATVAVVLSVAAVICVTAYLLRHPILNRYASVVRVLNGGAPVIMLLLVGIYFFGTYSVCCVFFGGYCSVYLFVTFWCSSDPMYDLMAWLATPMEWGRWPDEIKMIDKRSIPWPGRKGVVRCQLYRYCYGDEWETGITGPVTFSLFGEDLQGKPVEAIYGAYARWYEQECIDLPDDS